MVAAKARRASSKKKPESKAAPTGSHAPSAEAPLGKSIFLFADGTGNSSAKLFKTNVWRMYEAIDFGLASPPKCPQVGYYDNGVGTSNFRPLALLGGIFGIGLKENVLRLYSFLCRNYQPGDRIYAFGFSRGAFTIRLLVGLVATQGVLQERADAPLSYQVRDAYREFRRGFEPNRAFGKGLVAIGRAIRDLFLGIRRSLSGKLSYGETERLYADIEFVGVWDTVAAYGGPFAEFTRGIDDWVFPLTMPEYGLSAKVKKARHALSLDDERDAFWPLLWDEKREEQLIANGDKVVIGHNEDGSEKTEIRKVSEDRLRQVWFSGVHSDVGGGYPDESLSYIPLLWMMDELGPDVDFLPEFVKRAQDLASPYGPIHDSRSGVAAYYRYQPRKIAALTDPPSVSTRSLRPPESDKKLGEHGLLLSVRVHESAIARIISGIDNYAPSALPAKFEIVRATGPNATRVLSSSNDRNLKAAASHAPLRYDFQENAWDLVWKRRVLYFATVGVTIILALLPVLRLLNPLEELCSDDRCFARSIVTTALFFVPQSFRQMLDPWVQKPVLVMALSLLIVVMIAAGRRTERHFRDSVKDIWREYLASKLPSFTGKTKLRTVRESAPYQKIYYWLKWMLLPAICGIATLLAITYAAIIFVTQVMYLGAEPNGSFCKAPLLPGAAETVDDVRFDTAASCTDLGVNVRKGQPYRLTLRVPPLASDSPWNDGGLPADPRRGVTQRHWYMFLGAPLKRVTSANWMQVLTEVRADEPGNWARRGLQPILHMPIDIRKHELQFKGNGTYETVLCAPWNGRLYLMVNDAAPLLWQGFYRNNVGIAEVRVAPAYDKHCTKT